MSSEDYSYAENYFSEPAPQEQPIQEAPVQQPQAPQVDYQQQLATVMQELNQLKANPLQSLGYQPIQQKPQFDPEAEATAKKFLEMQGVMTEEKFQSIQRDTAAQEAGYYNARHIESEYDSLFFKAQQTNNAQQIAELNRIGQLYGTNPRMAIQAFKKFQEGSQSASLPQQSQTFGHVPSQQQAQSKPRFNSIDEFNAFRMQNPQEGEKLMRDWIEKKISPIPM